mmetsp:Transcript_3547/g.9778  ORF Transcript_3547/g.9778 Transcript_3547/m.9778 type:complete len:262 (-) Transcript_3547:411-1196(-)
MLQHKDPSPAVPVVRLSKNPIDKFQRGAIRCCVIADFILLTNSGNQRRHIQGSKRSRTCCGAIGKNQLHYLLGNLGNCETGSLNRCPKHKRGILFSSLAPHGGLQPLHQRQNSVWLRSCCRYSLDNLCVQISWRRSLCPNTRPWLCHFFPVLLRCDKGRRSVVQDVWQSPRNNMPQRVHEICSKDCHQRGVVFLSVIIPSFQSCLTLDIPLAFVIPRLFAVGAFVTEKRMEASQGVKLLWRRPRRSMCDNVVDQNGKYYSQ